MRHQAWRVWISRLIKIEPIREIYRTNGQLGWHTGESGGTGGSRPVHQAHDMKLSDAPGRFVTVATVYKITRSIKEANAKKTKKIMIFVDFEKVFDSL